jgi:cyclic-di-GMP-binding protein
MVNTLFGFQVASRDDPLANVKSIRVWSARLPRTDPVGAVEAIIHLLETAGAAQSVVTLNRLLAVMELDRISMPLQAQLRTQYRMAAMSDEVRQRLWRACDNLAHRFGHVYEVISGSMRAPGDNKKARAELHGIFARMFYYVGVQTRQGLFRYEQWIPGKWRVLHDAYREACEQGVVAEAFALDALTPPADRLSPEQEYVQILLLQRLNAGNLTAQQIDRAAEWLRGWANLLRLAMTPLKGEGYWLDLGRGEGLVTRRPERPAGELLYLDVEPLRGQLRILLSRLATQAGANPGQDELEEQLALAQRLDRLWLPRAPEQVRRGERQAAQHTVIVAAGWAEIVAALGAKVLRKARAPEGYHFDDYGRLRSNKDGGRSPADSRQMERGAWRIHDTSDSGFRIRSSSPQAARQRPGVLLAMQLEDDTAWQIGIVRRLKKLNAEQMELGVEIISRNAELIMAKQLDARDTGYSVNGIDIGLKGNGFHALYLPPHVRTRHTSPPSLVLPSAEFTIGRKLSLLVDGNHQDICLTAPLERTKDWVWSPLEVVQ